MNTELEIRSLIRSSGLAEAIAPKRQAEVLSDASLTVMRGGGIQPDAASPLLQPWAMHWLSGAGPMQHAIRPGKGVLLAAYAATPPSGGYCTVALTMVTEFSGPDVVGECYILEGHHIGEVSINVDIPAGAWLIGSVTTASGASGVSISLTIKPS